MLYHAQLTIKSVFYPLSLVHIHSPKNGWEKIIKEKKDKDTVSIHFFHSMHKNRYSQEWMLLTHIFLWSFYMHQRKFIDVCVLSTIM